VPSFTDAQRTGYLLECLRDVPLQLRGAHYTCCLAIAAGTQTPVTSHGYCYGSIALSLVNGPTGFGYDPIFIPRGFNTTVAQLAEQEKDWVGHRGKAVRALMRLLEARGRDSGTLSL
jgi:XTP/dITP diphosphohydrolase